MFNLSKFFKKKQDGFIIFDIPVFKITTPIHGGNFIDCCCSFNDFIIHFEFKYYDDMSNDLAFSKIFYKNVLVSHEIHNFSVLGFNSFRMTVFSYFYDTIENLKNMDLVNFNIVQPFFKKPMFDNIERLTVTTSLPYPFGVVYDVLFIQKEQLNNPYNFGRTKQNSPFQIISYNNNCFNSLFNDEQTYINEITSFNNIKYNLHGMISRNNYSLQKVYDQRKSSAFFNDNNSESLFYTIITCQSEHKLYSMGIRENLSLFKNNISMHVFWHVDFKNKSTKLNILVYDEQRYKIHTLIKTYNIDVLNMFNGDSLDENYYIDFFEETFKKLFILYYPSPKIIEMLEIDNFNGRLTEDQYCLFEMINI